MSGSPHPQHTGEQPVDVELQTEIAQEQQPDIQASNVGKSGTGIQASNIDGSASGEANEETGERREVKPDRRGEKPR